MNPDHLVELADQFLHIEAGRLRQAAINRAISTAYYALFHALCRDCVARLVGSPKTPLYWPTVTPVYRAVEHTNARRVFERVARDPAASGALKSLADTFRDLQAARIAADYDPGSRYSRRKALDLVAQSRAAIATLRAMVKEERLLLAVHLVTKPR